ncbi:346_t:CDS:2, partial [Paraglomus occultum]
MAIQQFCKNENREYLQDFSKQQYAWDLASQLLRSRDENTQFLLSRSRFPETDQILFRKSLPENAKYGANSSVDSLLQRPINCHNRAIDRASDIHNQSIPSVWADCIAELFQYLQSAYGRQDLAMELLLLEYLTVLPKEVSTAVFIDNQGCGSVGNVDVTVFSRSKRSIATKYSVKAEEPSVFGSWLTYDVPFKSLLPLISNAIELFSCEETHKAATEVLIRSLDQSSVTLIQDTFCDMMTRCFISEWTRSRIAKALVSGEDTIKNICRLMTEFGKTFPNYVAKRLTDLDIVIYLEMMLGFPVIM